MDRINTKMKTIKKRKDIQDGSNLPKREPQVSSILHMNTDQSGGLPGPISTYEEDMLLNNLIMGAIRERK